MQIRTSALKANAVKPWYAQPWPWLLMLGPFIVILAGIHTTWLAVSGQDALVVDDYYKQGKAINQSLQRDRVAASLKMAFQLEYDAAAGKLAGDISRFGQPYDGKISVSLIHQTQPDKDMRFDVQPDEQGRFALNLPLFDRARWQVLVESERRDWRLNGEWVWPQQKQTAIKAG